MTLTFKTYADLYRDMGAVIQANIFETFKPEDIPGLVFNFDASDPRTYEGLVFTDPKRGLFNVPLSPQIVLEANDFFITEKVKP